MAYLCEKFHNKMYNKMVFDFVIFRVFVMVEKLKK